MQSAFTRNTLLNKNILFAIRFGNGAHYLRLEKVEESTEMRNN